MAAYRRVYYSRRQQADCQVPGSVPEPYAQQSLLLWLHCSSLYICPIMWKHDVICKPEVHNALHCWACTTQSHKRCWFGPPHSHATATGNKNRKFRSKFRYQVFEICSRTDIQITDTLLAIQSCPSVGLTHGLGWVGLGPVQKQKY